MGQRIGKKFKRLLLTGLLMIALLTACAGKGGEESIEQSEADYKGITKCSEYRYRCSDFNG